MELVPYSLPPRVPSSTSLVLRQRRPPKIFIFTLILFSECAATKVIPAPILTSSGTLTWRRRTAADRRPSSRSTSQNSSKCLSSPFSTCRVDSGVARPPPSTCCDGGQEPVAEEEEEGEDTGPQVVPIVRLEEVTVTTGKGDEEPRMDMKSKL